MGHIKRLLPLLKQQIWVVFLQGMFNLEGNKKLRNLLKSQEDIVTILSVPRLCSLWLPPDYIAHNPPRSRTCQSSAHHLDSIYTCHVPLFWLQYCLMLMVTCVFLFCSCWITIKNLCLCVLTIRDRHAYNAQQNFWATQKWMKSGQFSTGSKYWLRVLVSQSIEAILSAFATTFSQTFTKQKDANSTLLELELKMYLKRINSALWK